MIIPYSISSVIIGTALKDLRKYNINIWYSLLTFPASLILINIVTRFFSFGRPKRVTWRDRRNLYLENGYVKNHPNQRVMVFSETLDSINKLNLIIISTKNLRSIIMKNQHANTILYGVLQAVVLPLVKIF